MFEVGGVTSLTATISRLRVEECSMVNPERTPERELPIGLPERCVKNRDLVFMNGEEQQRGGLPIKISQIAVLSVASAGNGSGMLKLKGSLPATMSKAEVGDRSLGTPGDAARGKLFLRSVARMSCH